MKTRIIYTKVWKDKFFASLTPTEKLLFIYLLTNERVNIIHCYELTEREVLFDTGVDRDTYRGLKEKLEKADKVYFYKDWVYLRNASKYESYTGESNERAKEKIEQEMSTDVFDWYSNILDTPLYTPLHTPRAGTINKKSEIRNKKLKGGVGEKEQSNVEKYVEKYNELFNREFRTTDGRKRKLKARLKTYSMEQILKSLKNLSQSPFHRGVNDRGWQADPDFLIRNDEQVDKWLNKDMQEAKQLSKLSRKTKNGKSKITTARL
jgi:hypothetical protein